MESNHARPPHQSGACPAGPSSVLVRKRDSAERNPALGSPPSAGQIPEGRRFASGFAAATAWIDRPSLSCRHPAGRTRASVPHPRKVALASTELRRVERSRRESNPPHPGDSRAAHPGASESVCCHVACRPRLDAAVAAPIGDAFRDLRDRESARRILDLRQASRWSSGESNPARVVASHRSSPSEPRKSDRRGSNPVRSAGNAVCFRPDTTVARLATILLPSGFPGVALRSWKEGNSAGARTPDWSGLSAARGRRSRAPPGGSRPRPGKPDAPSGSRTRAAGVRDRHPVRLDDRGVSTDGRNRTLSPRFWRPSGRRVSSVCSSSGGIRTTHPSVQSRRSCR